MELHGKGKRGFAAMAPEKRQEVARLGGQTAHQRGTGYIFTQEQQRKGGKKGGLAVSRNRTHMAAIGRKGGANARSARAKTKDHNGKAL